MRQDHTLRWKLEVHSGQALIRLQGLLQLRTGSMHERVAGGISPVTDHLHRYPLCFRWRWVKSIAMLAIYCCISQKFCLAYCCCQSRWLYSRYPYRIRRCTDDSGNWKSACLLSHRPCVSCTKNGLAKGVFIIKPFLPLFDLPPSSLNWLDDFLFFIYINFSAFSNVCAKMMWPKKKICSTSAMVQQNHHKRWRNINRNLHKRKRATTEWLLARIPFIYETFIWISCANLQL